MTSISTYIFLSVIVFLLIIFLLVAMLLGVKAKLLPSGPVTLLVNGDNASILLFVSSLKLLWNE